MKSTSIFLIVFLLPAVVLSAEESVEPQAVVFYNRTGYPISHIFITTEDTGYWGPDILGEKSRLENGEMKGILLHVPAPDTDFHFMAVDLEGYQYVVYDRKINPDKPAEIVFRFENFLEAAPELEYITLKVENDTVPLYRLYAAPAASRSYGADLLRGERILETGGSLTLLLPVQKEAIPYLVYAVDEDLDEYLVRFDAGLERPGADETVTVSIRTEDQLF